MWPELLTPGLAGRPGELPLWRVRADHVVAGPGGGTPCAACLRARLAANGHPAPQPVAPDDAAELGRQAMQQYQALGAPPGVAFEWRDGGWTGHLVLPLPGCRCAARRARATTLDAVSDLVGIVTRLAGWPVTGLAAGEECMMVLASVANMRAAGSGLALLDGAACGTPARARLAAVGEVLERYCAGFVPDGLPVATVRDLGRDHAMPSGDSFGGLPLGANDPVRWVRGQRLADGEPCWVQASAVYFPYRCHALEPPRSRGGSEGLAAGASWEAAVEHAAHERIERDALIRAWRYGGRRAALANPYAARPDLQFTLVGNRFGLPVVTAFAEAGSVPYATAGIAARATVAEAIDASAREACGAQALYRRFKHDQAPSREARYCHAVDATLRAVRRAWQHDGAPPHEAGAPLAWPELRRRLPDAVAVDVTTDDVRQLGVHVARVVIPGCYGFEPVHGESQLGGDPAPLPY